jgi:DNA topoisomerase-2
LTELPVGFWTEKLKEHLESLLEPVDKAGKKLSALIKDYDDMSKDTNIDFTITFAKGKLNELEETKAEHGCNGLQKLLKLYSTNSTTNMHLFNAEDKLKKYDNVNDIIDDYYKTRYEMYQTRKDYMILALERELLLLSNKAKYIVENLEGTIDLRKKKKEEVIKMLKDKQYNIIDDDKEYKYLTKMTMDSVTEENVEKLFKEKGEKEKELETIKTTSINQMWSSELDNLKSLYIEYKESRQRLMDGGEKNEKAKLKKKIISTSSKPKMNLIIEE